MAHHVTSLEGLTGTGYSFFSSGNFVPPDSRRGAELPQAGIPNDVLTIAPNRDNGLRLKKKWGDRRQTIEGPFRSPRRARMGNSRAIQ